MVAIQAWAPVLMAKPLRFDTGSLAPLEATMNIESGRANVRRIWMPSALRNHHDYIGLALRMCVCHGFGCPWLSATIIFVGLWLCKCGYSTHLEGVACTELRKL